jgi:cadmium resistance protein CadD (predicted permease)
VSVSSLVLLSIGVFASTNIDDLFLLVGYFSDRTFPHRHVIAGQVLGMAVIVATSLMTAAAALMISPAHVGVLGAAPIAVGLAKLLRLRKSEDRKPPAGAGILQVAAITIVNGGDNVAAYTPIFASQRPLQMAATVAIFAVLTLVWCLAALWLVRRTALGRPLWRYGHILLPFILIGLGCVILYRSGAVRLAMSFGPGWL